MVSDLVHREIGACQKVQRFVDPKLDQIFLQGHVQVGAEQFGQVASAHIAVAGYFIQGADSGVFRAYVPDSL